MTNFQSAVVLKKKSSKRRVVNSKTDSEFMHGTLGLLHGEGHEVLYANSKRGKS
jgi:tRNA (guanine-N7-)-methyltransferase